MKTILSLKANSWPHQEWPLSWCRSVPAIEASRGRKSVWVLHQVRERVLPKLISRACDTILLRGWASSESVASPSRSNSRACVSSFLSASIAIVSLDDGPAGRSMLHPGPTLWVCWERQGGKLWRGGRVRHPARHIGSSRSSNTDFWRPRYPPSLVVLWVAVFLT